MATGDKIKKFIDESRTGVAEAFIESEGEPGARALIPVEDLIVEGDLLGLWIINDLAPHVYQVNNERRTLDDLIVELGGLEEGDESVTLTLSFPYGGQIQGILDDWNKSMTDREFWIKNEIKARAA